MDILFYSIGFFILAVVVYQVDRNKPSYFRGWYNFWNKNKLPEEKNIGFVYQQGVRPRLMVGLIMSLSIMAGLAALGVFHILIGTGYALLMTVAMTMGFYASDAVAALWRHKDGVLDTIDDTTGNRPLTNSKTSSQVEVPPPPQVDTSETKEEETPSARDRLKGKGLL